MARTLARARLGLVAAGAFFGGLIVAAGVNLTPFGYAQQQATAPKPSAQEVKPLADASQAFTSIADHVTPAVVSIQTERRATTRANPRGPPPASRRTSSRRTTRSSTRPRNKLAIR